MINVSLSIRSDIHFKQFVSTLEGVITARGDNNCTEVQKAQVERLVGLERDFRRALIRHHWGKFVYQDFIRFIMDEKRNILEARPFFRERNFAFKGFYETPEGQPLTAVIKDIRYVRGISDFLRDRSYRGLYRFHFNYNFIRFVMQARKWDRHLSGRRIVALHKEIVEARNELVEMNLPLAISQARMFWSKMQKSHLTYMDFIQIAAEGLIAAIDKFCLPYTTVFRTVATHRMKGNFIDAYSETSLHFYPKDKKRLYQAYKYIRDQQGRDINMEALAGEINKRLKPNEQTTPEEIASLLGAASTVSANTLPVEEEEGDDRPQTVIDRHAAEADQQPDRQVETVEVYYQMSRAISQLTVFERKLLRLKGVDAHV